MLLQITFDVPYFNVTVNSSVMLLQITFDAPYLPGGGRHFDFNGLADVVDFLFIMAYDESYGCVLAWANSPLSLTTNGRFFGSNCLLGALQT